MMKVCMSITQELQTYMGSRLPHAGTQLKDREEDKLVVETNSLRHLSLLIIDVNY